MPRCQDQSVTFQMLLSAIPKIYDFLKRILLPYCPKELCLKKDLSSQLPNMFPDISYDLSQQICTNMWFLQIKDFLRSTKPHKGFHYPSAPPCGILDQCIQLSIREGSCSPFPKLYIAVFIQLAGVPKPVDVPPVLLPQMASPP